MCHHVCIIRLVDASSAQPAGRRACASICLGWHEVWTSSFSNVRVDSIKMIKLLINESFSYILLIDLLIKCNFNYQFLSNINVAMTANVPGRFASTHMAPHEVALVLFGYKFAEMCLYFLKYQNIQLFWNCLLSNT